jgi:hypothetical protein
MTYDLRALAALPSASFYVVATEKHPTVDAPHARIQEFGVNYVADASYYHERWSTRKMVRALRRGVVVKSATSTGDFVNLVLAEHDGHAYAKTVLDEVQPYTLLAMPGCG